MYITRTPYNVLIKHYTILKRSQPTTTNAHISEHIRHNLGEMDNLLGHGTEAASLFTLWPDLFRSYLILFSNYTIISGVPASNKEDTKFIVIHISDFFASLSFTTSTSLCSPSAVQLAQSQTLFRLQASASNHRCLRCGTSDNFNHIFAYGWSISTGAGGYYFQTQAKISVPTPAPPPH